MPRSSSDNRQSKDLAGILARSKQDYVTFELLEEFASSARSKKKLLVILRILKSHPNGIIRHEAAAQIAELRRKQPDLLSTNRNLVVRALLDCARKDTSSTARHEAIETLGYLGDKSILKPLKALFKDTNPDVSATAKIAIGLVKFRLAHPGSESDLGRRILDAQRVGHRTKSVS